MIIIIVIVMMMKKKDDININNYPLISLKNCEFCWDDEKHQTALSDINCQFNNGTITMIIGETGSGKSALLSSILGNIQKLNGDIIYNESPMNSNKYVGISYSSQVAWIQNCTVKDNILFGNKYNKKYYNKVIKSCALEDDLKILIAGDETEIGEKGINLSGGQKQRISLARAVYNQNDLYIFDDPLSAVDSHVANHIFNECFMGLLQGKTIILATHKVSFLKYADNIIVMDNGKIQMQGKLQDLKDANINLTKFIIDKKTDNNDDETSDDIPGPKDLKRQVSSSSAKNDNNDKNDKDKDKGKLGKEEERGVGHVKMEIYLLYFVSGGGISLLMIYLLFLVGYNMGNTGSTFWLAYWTNQLSSPNPKHDSYWYLGIYCAIQVAAVLGLFAAAIVALYIRLNASKTLFDALLERALHAPMKFFDTTPIGRIINRFSRDMYSVDQAVPNTYSSALRIMIWLFAVAVSIIVVTPYFAIIILPLSYFYWRLQKYFIGTSRELRRLSSLMNSPIFSHFSETLEGSFIIRAFNKSSEFSQKNINLIDADHKAYYPSVAANRWLAIRLEFLGNCIIGFAALSCAITAPSAGLIGVALSTVMNVTQGLNWFVRTRADLEQDIVAVERIDQYTKIEQESEFHNNDTKPKIEWPNNGEIVFKNVYMKYRPELDYVLKGLDFKVIGGEKVGVVGRTGAGKSSLFVTILRLVEIEINPEINNIDFYNNIPSQILIDNVDISTLGLQDLRSKISVIPQDPTLFTGTIRFNLDPFSTCNDNDLLKALELSHALKPLKQMAKDIHIKKEKDRLKKEADEQKKNNDDNLSKKKYKGDKKDASVTLDNMKQKLLINDDNNNNNNNSNSGHSNNNNINKKNKSIIRDRDTNDFLIGIGEHGIIFVNPITQKIDERYKMEEILTFGYRSNAFLFVAGTLMTQTKFQIATMLGKQMNDLIRQHIDLRVKRVQKNQKKKKKKHKKKNKN